MKDKFNITIDCGLDEGSEYAAWLNEQGHSATVGNSTGSSVNGRPTGPNPWAREISNSLWSMYCDDWQWAAKREPLDTL